MTLQVESTVECSHLINITCCWHSLPDAPGKLAPNRSRQCTEALRRRRRTHRPRESVSLFTLLVFRDGLIFRQMMPESRCRDASGLPDAAGPLQCLSQDNEHRCCWQSGEISPKSPLRVLFLTPLTFVAHCRFWHSSRHGDCGVRNAPQALLLRSI